MTHDHILSPEAHRALSTKLTAVGATLLLAAVGNLWELIKHTHDTNRRVEQNAIASEHRDELITTRIDDLTAEIQLLVTNCAPGPLTQPNTGPSSQPERRSHHTPATSTPANHKTTGQANGTRKDATPTTEDSHPFHATTQNSHARLTLPRRRPSRHLLGP